MNPVIQQDLLRKVAAGRSETHEASGSIPDDRFKKILKAMPVDENLREKDLFAALTDRPPFAPEIRASSWSLLKLRFAGSTF